MKAQPRSGRDHSSASGAGNAWSITRRSTPLARASHSNNSLQADAAAGLTEYIRAFATYDMGSITRSAAAGRCRAASAFSSMAWPSAISDSDRPRCQNRLVSASLCAARLQAGDDLAHFGVQGRLRQLARLDMRAQAAELAALALAPIVDDELGHDVGQRQLDRAHGAVGHHQRAGLDPGGLQQRCGLERREASTTISAPSTQARQSSVAVTGLPRSRARRSAKALRLSGRRECTRISSKSNR